MTSGSWRCSSTVFECMRYTRSNLRIENDGLVRSAVES